MAAAGRRTIAFDFLGFGASDEPEGAVYTFEQQLGDLEAVAKALELEKIIPVGHDAGGPGRCQLCPEASDPCGGYLLDERVLRRIARSASS